MGMVSVQKIGNDVDGDLNLAVKYYSILSVIYDLELPTRQIELLAFTAVRGTITPLPARQEFVKLFNSSLNTIENMKGKLYKKGLLIKVKDMYKVNPNISPDFSNDSLVLQLSLKKKQEETSD